MPGALWSGRGCRRGDQMLGSTGFSGRGLAAARKSDGEAVFNADKDAPRPHGFCCLGPTPAKLILRLRRCIWLAVIAVASASGTPAHALTCLTLNPHIIASSLSGTPVTLA